MNTHLTDHGALAKRRRESQAIRRALQEPDFRALAVIVGALLPFSQRARRRVLNFAVDQIAEEQSHE